MTDTYDDYRSTNGYTRPWHLHESDGHPDNEEDYRLVSERVVASIPAAELEIPTNRRVLDAFPDGVRRVDLPVRFIDSDIVVRVTIAGRGLDFVLDSGSSGIVIDSTVASQLGFKSYGRFSGTTVGPYTESETIVPEFDVGRITLKDLEVTALPFSYEADESTRIVGLLGFDFIADATIGLDYANGHAWALSEIDTGDIPAGAMQLPLALDDGVPVTTIGVGASSGKFIIDTGASDSMLFTDFVRAHPADVKDQGQGKRIQQAYPSISADGVGGQFDLVSLQLKTLTFGTIQFNDPLVFQPQHAPGFEGEDVDGLIGYPILRLFDVWFDYRTGTLFAAPNAGTRKHLSPVSHPG